MAWLNESVTPPAALDSIQSSSPAQVPEFDVVAAALAIPSSVPATHEFAVARETVALAVYP